MAISVLTDASVTFNSVDLSDHVRSVTVSMSSEDVDITAMGADSRAHAPGVRDDRVEVEWLQDYVSGKVDQTLSAYVGNATGGYVSAYSIQPSGGLVALAGSPFAASQQPVFRPEDDPLVLHGDLNARWLAKDANIHFCASPRQCRHLNGADERRRDKRASDFRPVFNLIEERGHRQPRFTRMVDQRPVLPPARIFRDRGFNRALGERREIADRLGQEGLSEDFAYLRGKILVALRKCEGVVRRPEILDLFARPKDVGKVRLAGFTMTVD